MSLHPDARHIVFRVLGPLEAWLGGERLHVGGPHQECVLLTLLLDADHVVSVGRLVESVWGDDPPATAEHQIRKTMADLRRRLPGGRELIATDGSGYRVVLTPDQLDLSLFTIRLNRAREAEATGLPANAVTELRSALALWRGPISSRHTSTVVAGAATVLEERRLAAAERLAQLRLDLGESTDLVDELTALALAHPLREHLRGLLIRALYRCGRQADALAEYERLRATLADELGIDPGPELTRLHGQILRNSPELDPPVAEAPAPPLLPPAPEPPAAPVGLAPCSLPYDAPDFTGREAELETLLTRGRPGPGSTLKIIGLDGMGGAGKTTLAVHAAHRLAESYPDGQLYVDLLGFTPGHRPLDPAAALETLLRTIGVPAEQIPDDVAGRAALWRVTAANRRLLVLLDNAADSAQCAPLLPGRSGCLVIVTSRTRLLGLDGVTALPIESLDADEGIAMLARMLGPARLGAEPEAAARLVELCGRLPLALRICAARLANRPRWRIGHLVDRLEHCERRLAELDVDNRSVAATISMSFDSLDPAQRTLLHKLSLHPGTDVDVFAAAALGGIPVAEAAETLEQLLDARLLEQHEFDRYRFHDLVRRFALDLWPQHRPAEDSPELDRLLDHYAAAVDSATALIQPGRYELAALAAPVAVALPPVHDLGEALAWFESERTNLMSALRLALARGSDSRTATMARGLTQFLAVRGYVEDNLEAARIAVEAARRLGSGQLEWVSLLNLAVPYWHLARYREALAHATEALGVAVGAGESSGEAACLSTIGTLHNTLGEYDRGILAHQRALTLHRELGNQREQAATLVGVSSARAAQGAYPEALESARQSFDIYRRIGDPGGEIMARVNVANAHLGLGDHARALAVLEHAREINRLTGFPSRESLLIIRTAEARLLLGEHDLAMELGREALGLVQSAKQPALVATIDNVLGRIHQARGEHTEALRMHQCAYEIASRIELSLETVRALEGAALALDQLGDHASAGAARTEAAAQSAAPHRAA